MGRVTQLAKDIVAHYEAIKGERIALFLDRDDVHWGDQWRDKVDDTLQNVAFFIPVISRRYFMRPECRRELQFFAAKTEALGIRELILPILYIDVAELHEEEPTDPLMQLVKQIQWTPWLDYRFSDRESGAYRAAVHALAQELVRRVEIVERVDLVAAVKSVEESEAADGEAGTLDKMAALEAAMPRWTDTLDAIRHEIESIGELVSRGTADMEVGSKQGKAFAARLAVARRVAQELGGPVEKIETLGQSFATDLAEIDAGVRAIVETAAEQLSENPDPADVSEFCAFTEVLRSLADSSREGLGSVENMIVAMRPVESMSKDMRPPLRRLRGSLTAMLEARDITASWVDLVDATGIDCAGLPAQS